MTIQSQYLDSFRQTQETWAGVVVCFTKDLQRTFGQPFNLFAVVDPNESIDQIFDFWARSLEVQRDVVKQLVGTTLAATEKMREQAEQVSVIVKGQADRVAHLTVKQAEHAKEQAEKVEQAVREQAEEAENAAAREAKRVEREEAKKAQQQEAEEAEKAAAREAKRVEREEAKKAQQQEAEEAEKAAAREAKRVEREEAKKVQQQAREAYDGLTKAELSDQLAGRGLPKTGNVEDLIERLVSADSE